MTVDPKLHRVYLPAVEYGPAARRRRPRARPAGQLQLLVVGK